jgi:pSer/pThr/pTyr-binding forkhead associated (FHA) protein
MGNVMTGNLRLRCLETNTEYPIIDGLVIGRDSACDIVLDSSEVSRRHAQLSVSGSAVFIEDLGSTNGIKVAGRKVGKTGLQVGQLILLGGMSFLVVDDSVAHDVTLLGAHMANTEASVVVDEPEDESTTFRGGYQLPPGWSAEDVAAMANDTRDPDAERQLLEDLLRHRGVTRDQAGAALMTLIPDAINQVLPLNRVDPPAWSIGRGDNVAVRIDHPTISALHATITEADGVWRLQDHDSTNGSEVDGQPVKSTTLEPGAQIKLGKVRLLFDVIA